MRSVPRDSVTRLGSVSAARMNVSRPTMPNWLFTMVAGMFVTLPRIYKNVIKYQDVVKMYEYFTYLA